MCFKSSQEFSNNLHMMFTVYSSYAVLLGFFVLEKLIFTALFIIQVDMGMLLTFIM